MRRLFRQIGVVEIEIANAAAVGECRPVWRRLVLGAKDRGSVFRREISRYSSRDHKRFCLPCAERAAQGIDYAPFHFVHDFLRKILKSQGARVISKLMSKRCFHVKKSRFQSADDFYRSKGSRDFCARITDEFKGDSQWCWTEEVLRTFSAP